MLTIPVLTKRVLWEVSANRKLNAFNHFCTMGKSQILGCEEWNLESKWFDYGVTLKCAFYCLLEFLSRTDPHLSSVISIWTMFFLLATGFCLTYVFTFPCVPQYFLWLLRRRGIALKLLQPNFCPKFCFLGELNLKH
jgi:hypothetical protein